MSSVDHIIFETSLANLEKLFVVLFQRTTAFKFDCYLLAIVHLLILLELDDQYNVSNQPEVPPVSAIYVTPTNPEVFAPCEQFYHVQQS